MKFLIDECISPDLKHELIELGHDVSHINDLGLENKGTPDGEIFDMAKKEKRIIITINIKHFIRFDPTKCGGIIGVSGKLDKKNYISLVKEIINNNDPTIFIKRIVKITRSGELREIR